MRLAAGMAGCRHGLSVSTRPVPHASLATPLIPFPAGRTRCLPAPRRATCGSPSPRSWGRAFLSPASATCWPRCSGGPAPVPPQTGLHQPLPWPTAPAGPRVPWRGARCWHTLWDQAPQCWLGSKRACVHPVHTARDLPGNGADLTSRPPVQGVVRPQSAVTLVGLALAPLYSWLLIFRLDWRLDGAAYAVDAIQVGAGRGRPLQAGGGIQLALVAAGARVGSVPLQ